jgi:hypothetical protein
MTIEFKAPEIGPNADALTSLTRGRGPRRGNLEDLLKYWRPIMKKPGGFRRCVVILMDKPQFGGKPQRICAWLHHELTGKWPNEGNHHGRGRKKRKKRRGRSVTRRVRSAGKKSLMGTSPLTEVTSLRMAIRESREFGGILVQPIAGRQNVVDMKVAMFLQHSEPLSLFAGNEVKRVGVLGSSSRLGQAAQAAGTIILPGDLSDVRSPIRSQIYETLTPGVPGGRRGRGGRLLRGTGRGARNKFRCPPGFEKGGTFTNSEFSTCGAQILGIATRGPGAPTDEANRRLSRLANTAGLVNEIGDLRKNTNAVDIIRAAQIPAAPKKGSPTRAQTSIDLVLARYAEEDFPTKIVRRDGVILEPVVSVEALGRLNEFDDMADGSLIEKYEAGQIGASTVPAFSAGLRNVFVSIPDAGAVQISRVGGEISDQERAGLLRSFATGISRSADLPDPSAAVRSWADGSDGRFTVDFGKVTDNGFEIVDGDNELIKVSTAGGKTETVPRWVYETFLSRSAPRRAKDAPIYEIVAEEGAGEKSVSPFTFSQKSVTSINDFSDILDAQDYHLSINSKVKAFTYLTEIDVKAPRGRGLGRRIGRGGRAVGGRSRAIFDGASGRYRCPPGTRYGGRFSDQFGRNCGYSLPRQIVNNLVDFGMRVEDAMERRRRRRVDASPGDGGTNLKPESVEKLDDAIGRLDSATDALGKVFEKTEGTQGGTLGRTIGEARRDVELTPEDRQLLEGNELAAALENLRDVLNDQDFNNANLDEIRKAYKSVERAANVEAGRMTDNPPRTPEQRTLAQKILDFLKEVLFRMLGIWNEDDERRRLGDRGGVDTRPGDGGGPNAPGGRRPRAGDAPIPSDSDGDRDGPRPRTPSDGDDGSLIDGDDPTPNLPESEELTEEQLIDVLNEFEQRAADFAEGRTGRTGEFLEDELSDEDLDRYIDAFEQAERILPEGEDLDNLREGLERLRMERDRRRRAAEAVGRGRDRHDVADLEGLADALDEFDARAEEFAQGQDGMTGEFIEYLSDEDIDLYIDAFGQAADVFDNEDDAAAAREILDRLIGEKRRRDLRNPTSKQTTDDILAEFDKRMGDYADAVEGGFTGEFLEALNDDDLFKFRSAFARAADDDSYSDTRRQAFADIRDRLQQEIDSRFTGEGKRQIVHPDGRELNERFNVDDPVDVNRAIEDLFQRMEGFAPTGGGMTQEFVESLNDDDLLFYEIAINAKIDLIPEGDLEDRRALEELAARFRAERQRRGPDFSWGSGSEPDERSLRNVRNRFPRRGLPDRAYWRDDNYDGSDAPELDRRFGRYYDDNNELNRRGRFVNSQLNRESSDTDPNAPGGAPDGGSPDDPDNLSRFSDDELRALLADDNAELPFNIRRISDEDLNRIAIIADEFGREFEVTGTGGVPRALRNVRIVDAEANALADGNRDPNRLGAGTPEAPRRGGMRMMPGALADPDFPQMNRRFPRTIDSDFDLENLDDNQVENIIGAAVAEHQELLRELREIAGVGDNANLDSIQGGINDAIRRNAGNNDRVRMITGRLQSFRELNQFVSRINRGDDERDVIRDHIPYLDPARRVGIVGLRDSNDISVDRGRVDAPDAIDDPSDYRNVLNDMRNRVGSTPLTRQFIDGLTDDELKAVIDADQINRLTDPEFVFNLSESDLFKSVYLERSEQNETLDELVARLEALDLEGLENLGFADQFVALSRLRSGENGGPPSRRMARQRDRVMRVRTRADADLMVDSENRIDQARINGYADELILGIGDDIDAPQDFAKDWFDRNPDLTPDELEAIKLRMSDMLFDVDTEVRRGNVDAEKFIKFRKLAGGLERAIRNRDHQLDLQVGDRDDNALRLHADFLRDQIDADPNARDRLQGRLDGLLNELIRRNRVGDETRALIPQDVLDGRADDLGMVQLIESRMEAEDSLDALFDDKLVDLYSNAELMGALEYINDPSLGDYLGPEKRAELNERVRSIVDKRSNFGSFQQNRPLAGRDNDALFAHQRYLNERLNEIPEGDRLVVRQLRDDIVNQLAINRAADQVADSVAGNPSLSARLRSIVSGNYDWREEKEAYLNRRRGNLRRIIAERYSDPNQRTPIWRTGDRSKFSRKSDAEVETVVRAMFSDKHEQYLGDVTVDGVTYQKWIRSEVTDVSIRRSGRARQDGSQRIDTIVARGRNIFILRDSDGNEVSKAEGTIGSHLNGGFERKLNFNTRPPFVYHSTLGFKKDVPVPGSGKTVDLSGGGAAKNFNDNAAIFYHQLGFKQYKVGAAADGASVWARQGYRSTNPRTITALNADMDQLLTDFRGYQAARGTGVTPTPKQYIAAAVVKDDLRAARLESLLEGHRNGAQIEALPGHREFLHALDGPNGERNSMAFRYFRGNPPTRINGQSVDGMLDPTGAEGVQGTGGISREEIEFLNNLDPEILRQRGRDFSRGLISSAVFGDGAVDLDELFADGWDREPPRQSAGILDAIDLAGRVPMNPDRKPMVPGDMRNGALDPVPVGANGISTQTEARRKVKEGADLMDIPDAFVADAMFKNSDHPKNRSVPDNPRFKFIGGDMGGRAEAGINNAGNRAGQMPAGMTLMLDTQTGQYLGFKGAQGIGFGNVESAAEVWGRIMQERFGLAAGQVRWDGDFNPAPRRRGSLSAPNRGIVVELAHNYLPPSAIDSNNPLRLKDASKWNGGSGVNVSQMVNGGSEQGVAFTGVDVSDLLAFGFHDAMSANPDRHGGNYGVYVDPADGKMRLVMFDNSLGIVGVQNAAHRKLSGLHAVNGDDIGAVLAESFGDFGVIGRSQPAQALREIARDASRRDELKQALRQMGQQMIEAERVRKLDAERIRMERDAAMDLENNRSWQEAMRLYDERYRWLLERFEAEDYDTLIEIFD